MGIRPFIIHINLGWFLKFSLFETAFRAVLTINSWFDVAPMEVSWSHISLNWSRKMSICSPFCIWYDHNWFSSNILLCTKVCWYNFFRASHISFCHVLLGNMWYYMVLDPIKDDALGPRHCILVLFVISWVNWDYYHPQGEVSWHDSCLEWIRFWPSRLWSLRLRPVCPSLLLHVSAISLLFYFPPGSSWCDSLWALISLLETLLPMLRCPHSDRLVQLHHSSRFLG